MILYRKKSNAHLSALLVLIAAWNNLHAESEAEILEKVKTIKNSPADVQEIKGEGPCGGQELTLYRQHGRIVRVVNNAWETCAGATLPTIDEFFDDAGNPIYLAYQGVDTGDNRYCGFDNPGQMFFIKKGVTQAECFELQENKETVENERPLMIRKAVRKGIPACSAADIKKSNLNCYLSSAKQIERLLASLAGFADAEDTDFALTKKEWKSLSTRIPTRGDVTCINANGVRLRNRPSADSRILQYSYVLDSVEILERGKAENISPWGKHPWFKVRLMTEGDPVTGWVFGVFIDNPYDIQDLRKNDE